MFRKEFIEIVTDSGMVTLKDLRPITLDKNPTTISEFKLLEFDSFDDSLLAKKLSEKYGVTYIDLSKAQIPSDVLQMVKKINVIQYRVVPIQMTPNGLIIGTYDPTILSKKEEIRTALKRPVEIILTSVSAWKKIFAGIQESVEELAETIQEVQADKVDSEEVSLKEEDIGQDVIQYVNRVLAEAYVKKASDIHFEPYEKKFRIRLRIDGTLIEIASPPKTAMLPILSRVKIMAQLDIAERRKPQDGRMKVLIGHKPIDYRVSSLPTLFGEKIVMRLLDSSNLQLDMTKLGFEVKQLEVFKYGIHQPYGLCLVTGPTGSGKTTTLYSALAELNTSDTNISTAEDPVEFNLEGINQVNVKKDIGFSFATALRAFLRQDPDVIMVGEIRDLETAEISVEAALTGHLVLSTLHTNDASSTITRLLNMGVEPFLVVASLNVAVAQRLLRKICEKCKQPHAVPVDELVACGIAPASAQKIVTYKGKGCENCNNTGYKGRVAIYEVLQVSSSIRQLILKNVSSEEIKKEAIKKGMKTLRMSALTKVAQGVTTLEEAVSVTASDSM